MAMKKVRKDLLSKVGFNLHRLISSTSHIFRKKCLPNSAIQGSSGFRTPLPTHNISISCCSCAPTEIQRSSSSGAGSRMRPKESLLRRQLLFYNICRHPKLYIEISKAPTYQSPQMGISDCLTSERLTLQKTFWEQSCLIRLTRSKKLTRMNCRTWRKERDEQRLWELPCI